MNKILLLGFVTVFFLSLPAAAQEERPDGRIHAPAPLEEPHDTRSSIPVHTDDPVNERMIAHMRELRQQQVKQDTDKLYQLTAELKQYVDKNGQNILSLDMLKKVETIEKLAHSVKQKMKENE